MIGVPHCMLSLHASIVECGVLLDTHSSHSPVVRLPSTGVDLPWPRPSVRPSASHNQWSEAYNHRLCDRQADNCHTAIKCRKWMAKDIWVALTVICDKQPCCFEMWNPRTRRFWSVLHKWPWWLLVSVGKTYNIYQRKKKKLITRECIYCILIICFSLASILRIREWPYNVMKL